MRFHKMPPRDYRFLDIRLAQWSNEAHTQGLPAVWNVSIESRKSEELERAKEAIKARQISASQAPYFDPPSPALLRTENHAPIGPEQLEAAIYFAASRPISPYGQCFGLAAKDATGIKAIAKWWKKGKGISDDVRAGLKDCPMYRKNTQDSVLAFDTPEIRDWVHRQMGFFARNHLIKYRIA